MFSLTLKKLREQRGLSQYTFARVLKISQSAVGNWEAGKRIPNSETLCEIADFFNVSVDYLLGRTENLSTSSTKEIHGHGDVLPRSVPLDQLSQDEQKLIEKYRKLPYLYQIKLDAYAEVFLEQINDSSSAHHA